MALRRSVPGLAVSVLAVVLTLPAPVTAAHGTGPAYAGDFPDPFVLRVGSQYHAYATQTGSVNVQHLRSPDARSWGSRGDALPLLPVWARPGRTWAPSVLPRGLGYVLHYTAQDRASGHQCLSVAFSLLPAGPYLDLSLGPWLCQHDRGGSIDPYAFVDADGSPYLLWKSDDNALGRPTSLWGQRLSPDGRSLLGAPVPLLAQDQAWEAPTIEGPAMVLAGGTYYLFYGANRWDSAESAIGYATCRSPLGPCTKVTASGPWLGSERNAIGPAGPATFTDVAGQLHFAYHAWAPGRVGYEAGGVRSLWVSRLDVVSGRPTLRLATP